MNTDVFICSYHMDAIWLEYALRSYTKFATGFRRVVVLIPTRDVAVMDPIIRRNGAAIALFDEVGSGHNAMLWARTSADTFTDADIIFNMDSDCQFTEPCSPKDWMTDGKPQLLIESYAKLAGASPWQPATERAMGEPVVYETMRRHPLIYWGEDIKAAREHLEMVRNISAEDYICRMVQQHSIKLKDGRMHYQQPGYCEHNFIGAFILKTRPEKYHVINLDTEQAPPNKLKAGWSHWRSGPKMQEQIAEMERTLQ